MSLNIAFTDEAKQFFEEHTAADLGFNCEISKNELSKEHIAQNKEVQEQYLQMKNINDGTWENFLKDQPPFDRYLYERRLTKRVLTQSFSLYSPDNLPFFEFQDFFTLLPHNFIDFVIFDEESVEFKIPDHGVYFFCNTNVTIEKYIKGSAQSINILSPSIEEAGKAYFATKEGRLEKDIARSHRMDLVRKTSRKVSKMFSEAEKKRKK